MSVEIKVPTLGESVTEATVAKWLKQAGDQVAVDEPVAELETDKVSLEVPAPSAGTLSEILIEAGTDVGVGTVIGRIDENGAAPEKKAGPPAQAEAPAAKPEPSPKQPEPANDEPRKGNGAAQAGPAARKMAAEHGVDLGDVPATGPKGNATKGDVIGVVEAGSRAAPAPVEAKPAEPSAPATKPAPQPAPQARGREERVRMTRLRKRIAERLKEAQNTAAMLTTFNEVDMTAVMAMRARYQDGFTKKHGVKLGFMGFFVKACIEALKAYPAANAEIDGDEVVYKHHYDIGVAVSTDQGLLVPVLRDADQAGLAVIEKAIADLGKRAREGKLAMEELQGGTFSITNGGIFGSLMSTPILNPPQVGILGMHKIQERPMVMAGGKIEARPMMYLALSYDHRIIDGREAVSFLVRVKECIEAPERILIDA